MTVRLIAAAVPAAAQVASFRVREDYGLRRFGYPVRAGFASMEDPAALRLLEEGKPVAAQFTRTAANRVEVDFNITIGPGEVRQFVVERAEAAAAPAGGIRIEETNGAFVVRYPQGLEFEVPKDLRGLLHSVRHGDLSYLKPGSPGLLAGGTPIEPASPRILKNGPMVAAIAFETRGPQASAVELEFPRSKSWMEVRWRYGGDAGNLAAELNLELDESPALVDFGAGTMVYAALRKGQGASLSARVAAPGEPAWTIDVGGQAYAAGSGFPLDGWAHMMDARRAAAVALDAFARGPAGRRETIETRPGGLLRVARDFARHEREKFLRFWVHFVKMPVQVGAATSPQSMQNPLKIEWP